MNIDVQQGAIQNAEADTIVVNLFEGVTSPAGATGAVDRALDGAIGDLIAGGDFRGRAGDVAVLYPRGAIGPRRVVIVGLGPAEKFDLEGVRRAAAAALRAARARGAKHLATIVHGAGIASLPAGPAAQATVEGMLLAAYRFDDYRRDKEPEPAVDRVSIVEYDEAKIDALRDAVVRAEAVAAGVYLCRDLVNMPPNVATPSRLAQAAVEIAQEHGLTAEVGDRLWAAEQGMGAFLAVALGAGDDPQFVVLKHNAEREDLPTVVLVGKGITFDTGGISLKSREHMGNMKGDMGGAAAVLGAMKAVGTLGLPLRVIAIAPCTENKPDALAYRPSDVIVASNKKSIEIISTDAEGRMALADGLVYAGRFEPDAVVDLATLTGAAQVALGKGVAAALFSNDDGVRQRLEAAAQATYERVWAMPLWDDYRERIRSEVADIKNSGGRGGGLGTSAMFLHEFVDYPWAHLDIAGMELAEKEGAYGPAGATGYGVRLLVEFLRSWVA